MFKLFRQYNKIILVIGAALLMVAFLIQGTLSMFMQTSPSDIPIGETSGRELTLMDRQTAAAELQILNGLNPVLGQAASVLIGQSEEKELKWLLMTEDARQMGISASDVQVDGILDGVGVDSQQLIVIARAMGASPDLIRQAVRHWLMVDQYRELMLGQTHISSVQRLTTLVQAYSLRQQAQTTGDYQAYIQSELLFGAADGSARLSSPLVKHYIADQQATVSGQVAVISSDRYLEEAAQPSDQELAELFEQFKDNLPGSSEPYGFGYRYPDRVKLEYLSLPVSELRSHVRVDEAERLAYYDENRQQFMKQQPPATQPGDTQPEPEELPYSEVRSRITEQLTRQKAGELAEQMAKAAQAILMQDQRGLPQQDNYRVLAKGYEPMPLQEVADQLEQRFSIKPVVQQLPAWIAVTELENLGGIGYSYVTGRPNVSFANYVASARELEPAEDNPLVPLRLQVGVAGQTLTGFDDTHYIFRLTAAEPSRVPASLDEVREQVLADARKLKAYELLLSHRDELTQQAKADGLESLKAEDDPNVRIAKIAPTRQRQASQTGMVPPVVPGVGSSEAFITALFEAAKTASNDGKLAVDEAPIEQRVGSVAVDRRLSLAVFRADTYEPMTLEQYHQQLAQGPVGSWVSRMVTPDASQTISLATLTERLNYQPAEGETVTPEAPKPPQRRPGSL